MYGGYKYNVYTTRLFYSTNLKTKLFLIVYLYYFQSKFVKKKNYYRAKLFRIRNKTYFLKVLEEIKLLRLKIIFAVNPLKTPEIVV